MSFRKLSFSFKSWCLLVLVCTLIFSYSQYWNKKKVIAWDITLYYSYLPAIFIYDDLKFENPSPEWGERQFYMYYDKNGNKYVKMTSGLAYLYAPFFLASHAFASLTNTYANNGFSAPYSFALLLSSLFFALWGLHFLRLVLKRFFSDTISGLVILIIFAGTNMPYYTFVEPMSHVYNFFLVSFIYWCFFRFVESEKTKYAAWLGLASGLLVLIRPTDIIALLFPIIYLIGHKPIALKKLWPNLILSAVMGFIMLFPHLLYWKYMTGNWVVYSYNQEGFFLSDPEIWKGLFSYRKGWFTYSPVLFLTIPGFVLLFIKNRKLAIALFSSILAAVWITFSWWCWWYGGGFGARPMIDFLPIMAFAMAAILVSLDSQKMLLKIPAYLGIIFLVGWGVFMNKQYKSQIFHWDAMSKELFWAQFFKDHHVENHGALEDHPDYEAAKRNEDVN